MNSQDKSSYAGLDALRNESAPSDLQKKILVALQPQSGRSRQIKVLRLSLATVITVALVGTALLAPRTILASAISKVFHAFQAIQRYHVKSFQGADGQRRLASETWVNGNHRKSTLYGPDGKPIPDSGSYGDVAAKIGKMLRGMTPKQLMDPGLKDKLSSEIGTLGPNSGSIMETITVDGQVVTDLPEGVKQQIAAKLGTGNMIVTAGGETDIAYLLGLLKDPSIWEITRGQTLNGKTVDKFQVKGGDKGVTVFVDPTTSLPVRLQMKSPLVGEDVTVTDEFDYPTSGR